MSHSGYRWTLRPQGDAWRWQVEGRDGAEPVEGGLAPTRAAAAALLIRAIARGVTADPSAGVRA